MLALATMMVPASRARQRLRAAPLLARSRRAGRVVVAAVARSVAVAAAVVVVVATTPAAAALAQADRPVVHPIYAHMKDAPQNDLALKRFTTATRRFGLGAVEVVDIEENPVPRVTDKLRSGIDLTRKLDFVAARGALDEVAGVVAGTGGGGLDAAGLSELYLYRAWAVSRADFNPQHVPVPTARAQAYADLARAAMLVPGRQLNPQQFPPLLLDDWARAVADVRARPQTTLLVRASADALVSCDGGTPVTGPATFVGLTEGEHLIHVDEPGWANWGGAIVVRGPLVEVDVPVRRALTLDDASAAARARRMGTKFALVAEPRPGRDGGLSLSLRLIDATGKRLDATVESLAGDAGSLDAAVMRLDEHARRLDRASAPGVGAAVPPAGQFQGSEPSLAPPMLLAPAPQRARLGDDPAAWARDHWPLLVAVGAMVTTAMILSIGVASNGPDR